MWRSTRNQHRHDVELLADVLTDLDHWSAEGAGALGLGHINDHVDAGKCRQQGPSLAAGTRRTRFVVRIHCGLGRRQLS
jgi:hypothetical protein